VGGTISDGRPYRYNPLRDEQRRILRPLNQRDARAGAADALSKEGSG